MKKLELLPFGTALFTGIMVRWLWPNMPDVQFILTVLVANIPIYSLARVMHPLRAFRVWKTLHRYRAQRSMWAVWSTFWGRA